MSCLDTFAPVETIRAGFQQSCLHGIEVTIALSRIVPSFKLPVEESHERVVFHVVSLTAGFPLSCGNLERTQLVFVGIVGIDALDGECGVAVSSPPPAEI